MRTLVRKAMTVGQGRGESATRDMRKTGFDANGIKEMQAELSPRRNEEVFHAGCNRTEPDEAVEACKDGTKRAQQH